MLTADETFPIIDNKLLEGKVEEPKFPAGKNTKQVPVEISKDLAEVDDLEEVTLYAQFRRTRQRKKKR